MANEQHETDQVKDPDEHIGHVEELKDKGSGRVSMAAVAHLEFVDGHPGVGGEALEHGHQELEAAAPVADQEHHADQVEDPHEDAEGTYELQRPTGG